MTFFLYSISSVFSVSHKLQGFLFILLLCISSALPATGQENPASEEEIIRVLAIGNSFSDDGVEYLDELAQAAGIRLIIGNLYIGGCSLERHWNNLQGELPAYDYRKNELGVQSNKPKTTLQEALQEEPWDYITVQQVSQLSGLADSYYPYLPDILDYLKAHAPNPQVRFAIHQVWAYACDSDHPGFAYYHRNQEEMYRRIVQTVRKVAHKEHIRIIIPSGTAIQTGRNLMGDRMNRDGFHLSYGLGRYIAACTWYEALLGSVDDNPYHPEEITPQEAALAQRIAGYAVRNPFQAAALP